MRKSDVTMHTDGYGRERVPAVNVKVDAWNFPHCVDWSNVESYEGFNTAWIEEHMTEAETDHYFTFACEVAWEDLQSDAEYIFGEHVKVESQGRSSGWAVVNGLPDLEQWDAVMLAKWARFAKWARSVADYVPESMVELIALNVYEPMLEEQERAEARRRAEAAAVDAELLGMAALHGPACYYCGRNLIYEGGSWVDPDATEGDDVIWRETCDAHDTFIAEHDIVGS